MFSKLKVLLCLFSVSSPLLANEYEYHPSLAFSLGAGYDPSDVRKRFLECIDFTESAQIDAEGSYASRIHAKLVQSRAELMQEVGVSARVSAQGMFGKFKSGVDYFDQIRFHEDSLTFLISAKEDYGRLKMQNPHLKTFAQKMIDEGRHEEFSRRCGTNYVAQVLKGASVFVIYSIHNLSSEHKNKINAMMSGGSNLGFGSIDFKASFKKLLEQFASSGRTEIHTYTLGGNGIKSLSEIPDSISDIEAIKKIIGAYMKTMSVVNGIPLIFYTASMENFGWQELSPFDVDFRDSVLEEYYIWITDLNHTVQRLKSVISQHDTLYSFLTDEEVKNYKELHDERVNYLKTLTDQASACYKEASQCRRPTYAELQRIKWPQAPDECEKLRLKAYKLGFITLQQLEDYREEDEVPFLSPTKKKVGMISTCEAFLSEDDL